jgi:hypothetical protein
LRAAGPAATAVAAGGSSVRCIRGQDFAVGATATAAGTLVKPVTVGAIGAVATGACSSAAASGAAILIRAPGAAIHSGAATTTSGVAKGGAGRAGAAGSGRRIRTAGTTKD